MSTYVDRYVAFFEGMTPASLGTLDELFSDSARFVDPFNDVRGRAAIRGIFEHMYATCVEPAFEVDERVCVEHVCYLRWTFAFGPSDRRQHINGVSRVRFGADGRAEEHIDYWDPARQVYERIPILGALCKKLRQRLGTPTNDINTANEASSRSRQRGSYP